MHPNSDRPRNFKVLSFVLGLILGITTLAGDLRAQTPPIDTSTECSRLLNVERGLNGSGLYQQAYDTIRHYIEFCASENGSYGGLISAVGDDQFRNNDSNRFVEFREWLKKVLYLNTNDPQYYCTDALSIAQTMLYFPGRGVDVNGRIAILRYLLASGKCKDDSSEIISSYHDARSDQLRHWRDSVKVDTNLYRLDTTIPSLQSLGLGILLGPEAGVRTTEIEESDLTGLRASENPFSRQTEIHVTTNSTEVVTFELFDLLGRRVQTNYGGQVLEAGPQTFRINGSKLVAGTYFVRVSTNHGMVKSLQMAREK